MDALVARMKADKQKETINSLPDQVNGTASHETCRVLTAVHRRRNGSRRSFPLYVLVPITLGAGGGTLS